MAEFKTPTSEQEFEQNFAQIKPVMNNTEAYYESSRCLFCYDAPCMIACPTSIDIPLFIKQIHTGNAEGAAKTIYDSNYLGNACGKICPTEVLCEGACVYNGQNMPAVDIGRLQTFATDEVIQANKKLYTLAPPNGKKVAIIGAGPAGLACACELRLLGYGVDIYEAKSKPSGLTIYGVAPYKITNEEVMGEMDWLIEQFQLNIKYNQPINGSEDIANLESRYDAIFIGIGLGETTSISLKGENLPGSTGAVEFIEQLRMGHHETKVGNKVVVIGGGNTAMDAASEASRMGAEDVYLSYRRGKEGMSAYEFEWDLAKGVGAKGLFYTQPVEILGSDKVEGVRLIKTHVVDGKLTTIAGSEFDIACDMVIRATGQAKQVKFLSQISGLNLDKKGRIEVNTDSYQTTNPKYFAGGDCVNGGAEVVNGAAEGKVAAQGIHSYLAS